MIKIVYGLHFRFFYPVRSQSGVIFSGLSQNLENGRSGGPHSDWRGSRGEISGNFQKTIPRQPLLKLHGERYGGVYVFFGVVRHQLRKFTVCILDFLIRWLTIEANVFGVLAKSRLFSSISNLPVRSDRPGSQIREFRIFQISGISKI